MQRRIGLTGGIASGKSTVGRLLEDRGWPVLDADCFARDALAPNSACAFAVAERYGVVVGDASALNRAELGRIVFNNPVERRWLEKLVHPLVKQRFEQELQHLQTAPVVVLMIPLLFEAGLETLCSEVWLVYCEPEQQLERLMNRNKLSKTEALARLNAQWPLDTKKALADVVIDNRGSFDGLCIDLIDIHKSASQRISNRKD